MPPHVIFSLMLFLRGRKLWIIIVPLKVRFLFPNAGPAEILRMASFMTSGGKRTLSPDILELVAHLDGKNQQDRTFQQMQKEASEQLQGMLIKRGRAQQKKEQDDAQEEEAEKTRLAQTRKAAEDKAAKAESNREQAEMTRLSGLTPADLRDFLPRQGRSDGQVIMTIEYHPVQSYFRVKYPCDSSVNFIITSAALIFRLQASGRVLPISASSLGPRV